jgi:hypothetical protein
VKQGEKRPNADRTQDWEAVMAEFDAETERQDREFRDHHLVISDQGHPSLTEEENEVLTHFLQGVSCEEMAKQYRVEVEVITGLIAVIQAKLSVT